MSTPDKAINVQGNKRSLDNPVTAAETAQDANTITPASSAKKAKTNQDADTSFRAWSSQVEETDKCTMYTLKCTFGDASKPVSAHMKSCTVPFLRNECQKRGLPSNGTKPVLLQRLQTEVPSVIFEIDSREALQRVVNSLLHYFKWDNTHFFNCEMPARGDLKTGILKLWQCVPNGFSFAIKMGSITPENMAGLESCGAKIGVSREIIRKIQNNPDTLSEVRKLSGRVVKRQSLIPDNDDEIPEADIYYSLEQLALKKNDKIQLSYNGEKFLVEVQDFKENVVVQPEEAHYEHDTRGKLLRKGGSKMRKQYDDGDWENMYYRF